VQAACFVCDIILLQSIVTSFANFSPFYKGVEEKGKKRQIKRKDHGAVDETLSE